MSALAFSKKAIHIYQLTLSVVNAVNLPNESGKVDNWLLANCSSHFVSVLAYDYEPIHTHLTSSIVNAVKLPNETGNVDS